MPQRAEMSAPDPTSSHRPGRVVFIGAGPGVADLITVRGARWLARAEVVLFDALTDPALRELAPRARWVDVGKRGFCSSAAQTEIDARLVAEAQRHAVVVRLKGGDPSVFGRLEEELQALAAAGIECEVVPGVTAAAAAAADALRPLTRRGRGRSVTLTTAMSREGALQAHAQRADTEVYYMAGRQLAVLGRRLLASGWPTQTPVCVVSRAGCPDSLTSQHTLAELGRAALLHAGRPSVVTVGAGATAIKAGPSRRASMQPVSPRAACDMAAAISSPPAPPVGGMPPAGEGMAQECGPLTTPL